MATQMDRYGKLPSHDEMLRQKLANESPQVFGPAVVSRVRRPDANSKILISGATKFLVLDGRAFAFPTSDAYDRLHYLELHWDTGDCNPSPGHAGICVHNVYMVMTFPLTDFPDIDGDVMDPYCWLAKAPVNGNPVCLIRSGYFHPIASSVAFDNYQFRWDRVYDWNLGMDAWDKLQGGVLLFEETGSRFR